MIIKFALRLLPRKPAQAFHEIDHPRLYGRLSASRVNSR
jgi:hypothetical protein